MLEFNPEYRLSAKQCLQNKIFDKFRDLNLEQEAAYKINVAADKLSEKDLET
jgi:hypothetical protein